MEKIILLEDFLRKGDFVFYGVFFNKIIKRNIEKVNKQCYNMKKQNGEKNEKNKWNNNAIL